MSNIKISSLIIHNNKLILLTAGLQSPRGGFQEGPVKKEKPRIYIECLKYRS